VDEHGTINVSFIVRIWLEEAPGDDRGPAWRGSVTHVPSGEKRYFESLARLMHYMALYLDKMGIASKHDANTPPMPEGATREEG
jgi:hypothetical protein